MLALLASCAHVSEPLSNHGGTPLDAAPDASVWLVCSWRFDWLGVVQVGGGECR